MSKTDLVFVFLGWAAVVFLSCAVTLHRRYIVFEKKAVAIDSMAYFNVLEFILLCKYPLLLLYVLDVPLAKTVNFSTALLMCALFEASYLIGFIVSLKVFHDNSTLDKLFNVASHAILFVVPMVFLIVFVTRYGLSYYGPDSHVMTLVYNYPFDDVVDNLVEGFFMTILVVQFLFMNKVVEKEIGAASTAAFTLAVVKSAFVVVESKLEYFSYVVTSNSILAIHVMTALFSIAFYVLLGVSFYKGELDG